MSRELIEFSNLIDEQFEPDNTVADELWAVVQSWFANHADQNSMLKQPVQNAANKGTRMVA